MDGRGRPRGYRIENRKLIVVPEEAAVVRRIFERYLTCGSIRELSLELKREGITAERGYEDAKVKPAVSRGAIYGLLKSPTYAGLIGHQGELYAAQHDAIVERELWEAVQDKLRSGAQCSGGRRGQTNNPLKGKLFDSEGRPLVPTHTRKNGKRYDYYVSHSDDEDQAKLTPEPEPSWRLPAKEIEGSVLKAINGILDDRACTTAAAQEAGLSIGEIEALERRIREAETNARFAWLVRASVTEDALTVETLLPTRAEILVSRKLAMQMKRRGVERKLILGTPRIKELNPDPHVLKALRTGHQYWARILSDPNVTAMRFADERGLDNRYVGRTLQLAFLAPSTLAELTSPKSGISCSAEDLLRKDPQLIWGL